MQYEIDYMPVGTGEKGGDAIALRYGDFSHRAGHKVVVIDGGTKDSGKKLIEHIRQHYGTDEVDLVVGTHLHNDHISGLTEVLENLKVKKLALHLPWDYTSKIKKMTKTGSTIGLLQTRIEKSVSLLSELVDLTQRKNIPVVQPFEGEQILDNLFVLGPSKEYYLQLLANFGITPEVKEEHKIQGAISFAKEVVSWVAEALHIETLSDDYEDTSYENNSSLVLLLMKDEKKFLFTGDAGKDALTRAINFSDSKGVSLLNLDFFDVPHHGSKRNLGPAILNRLMPKVSFISCPPGGDPKHPSRKVINALIRRVPAGGYPPYTTKNGFPVCHNCGTGPQRVNWSAATPESFHNEVED